MTNFTPHLTRRGRRYGAALLLAALFAPALGSPAIRTAKAAEQSDPHSYGWPVAPFNRQHPIRGGFGDPRTLFNAPPTHDGVYHGAGQFTFHEGVDIAAPDGTAVYPVADGVVATVATVADEARVVVDSGSV